LRKLTFQALSALYGFASFVCNALLNFASFFTTNNNNNNNNNNNKNNNNNNIRRYGLLAELASQLPVIQYIKHYIKAAGSG